LVFALFALSVVAAPTTDRELAELLRKHADDSALAQVLANPEEFDLQIRLTQLSDDGTRIKRVLSFREDQKRWFSPASTVKLPLAILALEQLKTLGVNRDSRLSLRYPDGCQPAAPSLPEALESEAIERTILRSLVVSDNEAANRLYQWLGPSIAHERFRALGLPDARLIRPLMVCSDHARTRLGAIEIRPSKGNAVTWRERSTGPRPGFPYGQVLRGKAWLENGVLNAQPRDFTDSNFLALSASEQLLMMVVRPDLLPPAKRSSMHADDRAWLKQVLRSTPDEITDPRYPSEEFPRHYAKFLYAGDGGHWPKSLLIYNKIGEAYGYLTDIAYFHDQASGTQFFLSATIYVDRDGTLNDGVYAYRDIGYPFLARLGRIIFAHEQKRFGRK
jgi:hypothetical protein